jgi:uncharacterized lipoprotein YmbA
MKRMLCRTGTLLAMVLLLVAVGCTKTPPPTFYQLEEPAGAQLAGVERGLAIGVGPLTVAAYLDRPQIVTRATAHRLTLSEANIWAEPLKESILRVIAVNLSNMLETNRVFRVPRRDRAIPLAFRVAVVIARFDGALGGDAQLTARWTLYRRDDRPVLTRVTIVTEPAGGPGYDNLIVAQNRALQSLSREIAEAVKSNTK